MAETIETPNGTSPSANAPTTEFGRSIGRQADTAADTTTSLREMIDQDITSVKETAQDVAHKAADKAEQVANLQKGYAADQIGRIAGALERVGEELRSSDAGMVGSYATQLGASAKQFADKVKNKNFSEIAGIAEDFGRRQPLAFLSLATIAGLAASRFMMASKATASSESSIPSAAKETYNG